MIEVAEPYLCRLCPLQKCSGLRPLEDRQRAFLQEFKSGEVLADRGEDVIVEGRIAPSLFTILEGVFIRYRTMEDGRRQIVNFMFPGDLVGLQAAFEEPSAHTVETLIPGRLCRFRREDFTSLMREHPRLGFDVTWLAAQEENALEGHIVSLGQRNAKERLVYLAVWLLDRALSTCMANEDNILEIAITQAQIADMLGLSLVHTNRTIRALDKEGLVEWAQRELCVPDMAKAADFAGFDRPRNAERPFI